LGYEQPLPRPRRCLLLVDQPGSGLAAGCGGLLTAPVHPVRIVAVRLRGLWKLLPVGAVLAIMAAIVVLTGAASGAWPTTRIGRRPSRNEGCGFSNMFAQKPATLRACGYLVYPLIAIQRLPKGVRSYVYSDGVRQLIPPRHFKPLTASNRMLNEAGFPTKPAGGVALARWRAMMSQWKASASPQPFDVSDPDAISRGQYLRQVQTKPASNTTSK
jgi:hypothetical protein